MSVKEKKINYLVSINDIDNIEKLKRVGINTFLFALKDYSIGYEKYFTIDEINNIDEKKYVLINKVLNTVEIENLKKIVFNLNVDGIIFEDIGLINVLKDYNKDKILFMNHFNTNSMTINEWLKYVDSVVLSNELTYSEYEKLVSLSDKEVVLNIFGYNQVMYSKRSLITNFENHFNENINHFNEISDKNSDLKFKIIEQDGETIILSNNIFDGRRLLNLNNIKYYYINSSFIDIESIIKFINNESIDNSDEGFLDKPTFYKLKGEKK